MRCESNCARQWYDDLQIMGSMSRMQTSQWTWRVTQWCGEISVFWCVVLAGDDRLSLGIVDVGVLLIADSEFLIPNGLPSIMTSQDLVCLSHEGLNVSCAQEEAWFCQFNKPATSTLSPWMLSHKHMQALPSELRNQGSKHSESCNSRRVRHLAFLSLASAYQLWSWQDILIIPQSWPLISEPGKVCGCRMFGLGQIYPGS